ncbi:hypothetical protein BDN71DRAFT_1440734 [Pleurotus eryngii]|uniref:Uncharacterized protein n=1 Tax=Pleurotus eryngii TaxID=5323 RepID=A0A9P6A5V2_PLEER|nr:hypothetical protein BDN71DRAFT_1440734 [Pleurotus eryngii]
MAPSSWIQRPATHTPYRVYERPLGHTELSFYHDSLLSGTSDTTRHVLVQAQESQEPSLFSELNVARAWVDTKQYFPLLGSQMLVDLGGASGQFIVNEEDLWSYKSSEVHFLTIDSARDAEELLLDLRHGERRLNSQTLVQVYILRRVDLPSHYHVMIQVAHAITDGMSNIALLKYFMDSLCTVRPKPNLEERLGMAMASEELDPCLRLSLPRQRWIRAISEVIRSIRWDKLKGGHTLPQIQDPFSSVAPPKSYLTRLSLPEDMTKKIIATCRRHSLTFGHVYAVLAQIAITRILCRRYVEGCISQEEWEMRRRQPMHTGGPLNLRPYLDKEWLAKGGHATVGCAIAFFWYTLPFMPLGSAANLSVGDNLPSFAELLSRDRFFLRTDLVKKQSNHTFRHPLFGSIVKQQSRDRIQRVVQVLQNFEAVKASGGEVAPSKTPFVLSFAGSSMGNVENIEQYGYPSRKGKDSAPQTPLLRIIATETYLRCRPGELYLGSATARNMLHMYVFFDGNAYEESTVDEWLKEIKDAAIWYLGEEDERQNQGRL